MIQRRSCGEKLRYGIAVFMTHIVKGMPRALTALASPGTENADTKHQPERTEAEVEPKGIEPSTSCMPCRRSPK
jgi:hypothetical protein